MRIKVRLMLLYERDSYFVGAEPAMPGDETMYRLKAGSKTESDQRV